MKKIFNFTKKKKGFSPNTSDTGSVLSVGYDLKEKDLGKVHKAAYVGDLAKLKQLAKKNDINQLDKDNRTALHLACANGHSDVVQFLVEVKAKLNLCDNQCRSPLMKAVQCHEELCVTTLLEHDADPNLVDINGNTALHLASCIPAMPIVTRLLEHEADINAQNKEGYSPLTVAVKENHAELAEFFLKEGADVNIKDQGHRSPLMIAACNGQISMVRLLLHYDADITLKDNNGWSADDYAVMNGHHACSHLIIEHGPKRKSISSPATGLAKNNQMSMLGSSSQETGFALGGPATDKEDVDDNSQTESMSRPSKSVDDSWPSSDEDDKLEIAPKTPQKLNLKKLMNASNTKKNDAVPVSNLDESERESKDKVQRNPSLPKEFPSTSAPQHPVSPLSTVTFNTKPFPIPSTPLQSCQKDKYSTEDDEDTEAYEQDEGVDKEVEDVDEQSYKEELNETKMKQHTAEQKDNLFGDDSIIPGSEDASKQRDFLSELGLEKADDDEDSWDTESCSGSPKKLCGRVLAKAPGVSFKESKEVLRIEDEDADNSKVPEKSSDTEKVKRESLSVFGKLEFCKEEDEKKTDVSECDMASMKTLSGSRPPFPEDLEAEEDASVQTASAFPLPAVQDHEPDTPDPDIVDIADRDSPEETRPSHSDSPLPSPRSHFPQTRPQLQPRAKKMLPQTAESEEESDWDFDHVTTSSPVRPENQQLNIMDNAVVFKPDNLLRLPSPIKQESNSTPEPEEKPQQVGESKTKIKMEVLQKSSASWDAGRPKSKQSENNAQEKPETTSEHPEESKSLNGATEGKHQLILANSISQMHWSKRQKSSNRTVDDQLPQKKTGGAVANEATLLLPPLGGGKHGQAQQATNSVNGPDPIAVVDHSTLSDVSDDGRPPSERCLKDKAPATGEMDMVEEFDELTESSDTTTSDIEDPSSGYRHASSLIKQLNFATLDSVSMIKLRNMFNEYERTILRERGRQGRLLEKMCQLEAERVELRASLEESCDRKKALDHRQLELDTDLNNLKFQLKQEQEKHRNASMLYEKTRELLRKKEEDLRTEAEGKHKVELALRNLELENRAILNNMKQLEEDRSETQKLLNQERGARALSETLLNNHVRKQQEIEEENRRTISRSNEALSQLTEATDRERELLQQNSVLQDDLSILRVELERSGTYSRQKESCLKEECEALQERLEDARRDLKLNEEALSQTVYQFTTQLNTMKAELSMTTTRLEHERQARELLEADGESGRVRLTGALQEAERCQAARADSERALQQERKERQLAQDKLTGEAANKREAVGGLSQKLAKAESRTNSLENEVHRITMTLAEMEHIVTTLQREKELMADRVKELEAALQVEREQAVRACARQEALQERLAAAQSETMLIRQYLEESQNKGMAKEKAVTDAQERFGDLLAKLRSDSEERVQLVEERSKELATKAADLRDQVYKLEEEKNERETSLRQLQQELADSLKKLSMSEASLEVNTRYRNDLEEEKARLLKDMDRLKGKLEETEDQHVKAERCINALKSDLVEKDHEVAAASRKMQEVLLKSAGSDTIIKQLEEAVQSMEIKNAKLEAAAKHQTNRIEALQKEVQDFAHPPDSTARGVRNHLEDLVTGLEGSKMTLEEQLSLEVQKQSMLSHNAQDSHTLWEEELKSRSKLGLRMAELEKEKADLSGQIELERKKARKIVDQKKSVDTRLDQEMKRNTELQKEMYRLRALVKTAKKKLLEQDMAGADWGSPIRSTRGEMDHRQTEASISRMKDKMDDLSVQLQKETSRCSHLEGVNKELKEQLASFKNLGRSNERLERCKKHLEEELFGLRRQVESGVMDQSKADQYRCDAEERARQEIRQKLEEVNLFLQTQAASQEALDQIKAASEASLRSTLEQRIRELEGELGRARSSQQLQDSMNLRDSTHTELERYRELYMEELHLRKSLAAKLERSNERLADANGKLLNERHRSKSLIASSIVNGSLGIPSPMEMSSLWPVSACGAPLRPPNRSLLGEGVQSNKVEAYLAKVQNELERNIAKELDHGKCFATADLEGSARVPPVGSASGSPTSLGVGLRVEQDPVSRAMQQYLEVLKKNYMI
ncbi:hypothetical protein DPEC_G00220400 [Dallia pectoralis]|uniref:Uncharacterized protein n=1 Tax=Dallia pectoralis TaxID=75939 RepID=A0ACC2G3T8_DALPE|nr:hypothetical protein DPEC_G00220400 [Dallia pectoralis]